MADPKNSKKLPNVISEQETLDACATLSVSRWGDGELNCAIGRGCSSQRADKSLAIELTDIIQRWQDDLLVCVPNFAHGPRVKSWAKYAEGKYAHLYRQPLYGSAFISRPDSAPTIDRPDYWAQLQSLWTGKDITLVVGDEKSLTVEMLADAKSVRVVRGPRQHAYAEIDRIEAEIGTPRGTVMMCLGATATCLAARLNRKGVHALDLGHVGLFAKHAGAYRFSADDLASPEYRALLQAKHRSMKWGKSGHSHAPEILALARELGATSVLDYGAGCATLKASVQTLKVLEYDPGTAAAALPKPADLVVSCDVNEHIEPAKLNNVLRHQYLLARKGGYFVIALTPAREKLADGRNAHLTLLDTATWLEKLEEAGWKIAKCEKRKGLCVWCVK